MREQQALFHGMSKVILSAWADDRVQEKPNVNRVPYIKRIDKRTIKIKDDGTDVVENGSFGKSVSQDKSN